LAPALALQQGVARAVLRTQIAIALARRQLSRTVGLARRRVRGRAGGRHRWNEGRAVDRADAGVLAALHLGAAAEHAGLRGRGRGGEDARRRGGIRLVGAGRGLVGGLRPGGREGGNCRQCQHERCACGEAQTAQSGAAARNGRYHVISSPMISLAANDAGRAGRRQGLPNELAAVPAP